MHLHIKVILPDNSFSIDTICQLKRLSRFVKSSVIYKYLRQLYSSLNKDPLEFMNK